MKIAVQMPAPSPVTSPLAPITHFENHKDMVDFYVAVAARLQSWHSELYDLAKAAAVKPLSRRQQKRYLDINSSLVAYEAHLEDHLNPLPQRRCIEAALKAA